MASGSQLVYPIIFDASRARKGVNDAERELTRLNRVGMKAMGGLKTAGMAAGVAVVGLGIAAAKFGTDSVRAFMESEKAMAKVKAMTEAAGVSWKRYGDQIDEVITKQSKMSGFDDEELAQSFANIVRVTHDHTQALNLNATAMDIARGRGISLKAASDLLTKVWNGNTSILKRYGITLQEGATRQQALAAIQRQFSGQAEAYGQTTQGAVDRASVAWENLQEQVGAKLAPILAKFFNWVANSAIPTLERWWPTISRVAGAIGGALATAFQFIADRAREYWPAIRQAVESAVKWIGENVVPIIQGVISAVKVIWERFGPIIIGAVRNVISVVRPLLNALKAVFEAISAAIKGDWSKFFQALKSIAVNLLKAAYNAIRGLVDNFLNAAKALGQAIWDGIKAGAAKLAEFPGWLWQKFREGMRALTIKFRNLGHDIGVAIWDGMKSAIGSIWDLLHSSGDAVPAQTRGNVGRFTVGIYFGRNRGGYIPGRYSEGDVIPAMLSGEEAVLTPLQQRLVGIDRINSAFARTGAVLGGGRFASGGWVSGVASVYGGTPGDDNGYGAGPFSGQRLSQWNNTFAEMNYGRAMGGLPYGQAVQVRVNGKSMTLVKRDIGGNPGNGAVIDIHANAARVLGISPTAFLGRVSYKVGGARPTAPGVPDGGTAASAAEAFAAAQEGEPYGRPRDGQSRTGPNSWDCSGFAIAVAKAAGANVTEGGTTADAWRESSPLSGDAARNAPVVWGFYSSAGSGGTIDGGYDEHMGVRINGVWWDASGSANRVRKGALDDSFWNKGIRLPRGLSATLTRAVAGAPTTASTRQTPAVITSERHGSIGGPDDPMGREVTTIGSPGSRPSSSTGVLGALAPDLSPSQLSGGALAPMPPAPPAGARNVGPWSTAAARDKAVEKIDPSRVRKFKWAGKFYATIYPAPTEPAAADPGAGGDPGTGTDPATEAYIRSRDAREAKLLYDIALAEDTPGIDDDRQAWSWYQSFAESEETAARAGGDYSAALSWRQKAQNARQHIEALSSNTSATTDLTTAIQSLTGAIAYSFRGQGYYVGQGSRQSSESLLDVGVGI